jgi:hypothetical protein
LVMSAALIARAALPPPSLLVQASRSAPSQEFTPR